MNPSKCGISGLLRAGFKYPLGCGLLLVVLGQECKQCDARQSSLASERCWHAEDLRFPPGTRDDVLRQSVTFLTQVESIPTHPYWPPGNSGITIGVGWDLGQHSESELRKEWSGLGAANLTNLSIAVKKTGRAAEALLPEIKGIYIRRALSASVLEQSIRDVQYPLTLRLFPGTQLLPAEFQVVLLSVIFNRGVALGRDPDWRTAKALDTRWEMRKLQGDVARKDLFAIYLRLGTMKRIWESDPKQRGLPIRRKDEQHLIRPYVDKVLQWEQKQDALRAAGLPPCPKDSAGD